ncbi:N-acetylmuramic acid 6-phosphate etherase [bacterium]|nr:N-acetylmuramic acid 6-phosphate etherase [bacterium]
MNEQLSLGVEGGGRKTDWVLIQEEASSAVVVDEGQLPPTNFRLITEHQLIETLKLLPSEVARVGIFLAGCVTEEDRARLRGIAEHVWPHSQIVIGSDRDSGLAAAFQDRDGIIVISGTGSAVTGRKNGRVENAGGRGHLLGDHGGGYVICMEGLRLVLRTYDLEHRITPLARELLRALMLNRMEDLIAWTQSAEKMSMSALLPVMFQAAQHGDQEMLQILEVGAVSLAEYTRSVARWLNFDSPSVRLLGGVFVHQPSYVDLYRKALKAILPTSSIDLCTTSGAMGAGWLARSASTALPIEKLEHAPDQLKMEELNRAVTEQTNPRSVLMDQMSTTELVELFLSEEHYVTEALESERKSLEEAVELITSVFQKDGKLFYVGAGTSGRLGTLDASEIPPTFGEPPDRVQAIIAGGATALHTSVEGAEDDEIQGARSIVERGVTVQDVVCGISASGRTPFILSALNEAKKIEAKTILLTCNPARSRPAGFDLEIDLPTGPELIIGSTRLKAGTATKVTLNILSTCALIKLGKIQSNWMVGVNPSNSKLRERAIRIVSRLRNVSLGEAKKLLEDANWNVRSVLNR